MAAIASHGMYVEVRIVRYVQCRTVMSSTMPRYVAGLLQVAGRPIKISKKTFSLRFARKPDSHPTFQHFLAGQRIMFINYLD